MAIRMVVASILFLSTSAVAAHAGVCPGDLNNDCQVTQADLGILLADFGCTAGVGNCPGDVNGDGKTDQADLGILLAAFNKPCEFEYPRPPTDEEAEQIALEMLGPGGPLFASPAAVQRVATDLALIRALEPTLASQLHSPKWIANHLLVNVNPSLPHDGYNCLKQYYGATIFGQIPSMNLEFLSFPRMLNPQALGQIFVALPEVGYAEPNGIYGGDNFYVPTGNTDGTGNWFWFVDDGFWDCFDGCDCHYYYEFLTTEDGQITLLNKWTWFLPWCPSPK